MAENLKVDVDGLVRAGSDVGEQAAVLSASHLQSIVGLSDSEPGWVGSSADALVRMAHGWHRVADQHRAALTEQAMHVTEAAGAFQFMDQRSAAELDQIGD